MIAIIVSILALIVSVFALIEASIASGTTNEVGDRISFVENMVRQHEQLFKAWGDWREKLVLKRKRREEKKEDAQIPLGRVTDIATAQEQAALDDLIREESHNEL